MAFLNKIGFGTYKITGETCINIVEQALLDGYRTIDTATLYRNHPDIAEGIKKSNIRRQDIFLISKIHIKDIMDDNTEQAFYKIIKELDTDYLDMLLLHAPKSKEKNVKSWKILEELCEKKLVKYIGVSNYRVNELEEILEICTIKPFVNQIELSPFNTRIKLVQFCQKHNIIIQAYSSLTKGNKLKSYSVMALAIKYNITVAQLLLRWAHQHNYYVIPKTINKIHLKENLQIINADFSNLSDIDMKLLDSCNEDYYTITYYRD
jgi:diketogulonate reductase-like aldo/keto reductase